MCQISNSLNVLVVGDVISAYPYLVPFCDIARGKYKKPFIKVHMSGMHDDTCLLFVT